MPLSHESLMQAIALNGAAVEMNRTAFNWGRLAAHDIATVKEAAGLSSTAMTSSDPLKLHVVNEPVAASLDDHTLSQTLDEVVARRISFLTDYQNAAYAAKFKALVDRVRSREEAVIPGSTALSEAVARNAFKLMAYKDEYEVARIYTSGDFEKRLRDTFTGDFLKIRESSMRIYGQLNAKMS